MHNISELIEDDYKEVKFKKRGKDYSIRIRGITAYDLAVMWKESVLRDVLVYLFDNIKLTDSETIYHHLISKAPLLITTCISVCDYDNIATLETAKRMPMSAQLECFNAIIGLTFNKEENDKIGEELKKLIADAQQLMILFLKKEETKD